MSHRRSVTLRPAGRGVGVCGLEAILVLRSVSNLDVNTGIVPKKKVNVETVHSFLKLTCSLVDNPQH